jgi:hypothetical protein
LGQDGKLVYEDDDHGWGAYDGEVDRKSRERIGNGKMTYDNGSYYEGGFVNNKREGDKCFFRWPNGSEYEGGIKDGRYHGVGIIRSRTGCFVECCTSEMGLIVDCVQWSADGKKAYRATLDHEGTLVLDEMRCGRRADWQFIRFQNSQLHDKFTEISLGEAKKLAKKVYKLPVPRM